MVERRDESEERTGETEIVVRAPDVDGIVRAIGVERDHSGVVPGERPRIPEELHDVLDTLGNVYRGVERATEVDSRGRSRKKVRQYADLEDRDGEVVGHHLRVLEEHGLVVQDGNRWRTADRE